MTAVRVVVATRRHGRDRNEDAIGIAGWVLQGDAPDVLELRLPVTDARPAVLALVDGMGGHAAGDAAARIAAERLTSGTIACAADLGAALVRADGAVRADGTPGRAAMGCTAVVAVLTASGGLWVAHAGDVRAYRVVDDYPVALTADDRPGTPPDAAPSREVTRFLGGSRPTASADRWVDERLRPAERLLLCTDGVHDAVGPAPLRRCLRDDLPAAADRLVDAASADGDNATVVLASPLTDRRLGDAPAHGLPHAATSVLRDVAPARVRRPHRAGEAPSKEIDDRA